MMAQPASAVGGPVTADAFDVPGDVIYLNCASLAPRLKSVTDAGQAAINKMAKPWDIQSIDWFQDPQALAALFARLIRAPIDSTTLIPSVSYGIAIAARNISLKRGANLVLVEQEYPSNYYSWRKQARQCEAVLRCVSDRPGVSLTDAIVSAIDRDTAVVAVPNCRWTDGVRIDLARVGRAARQHGAALVVDASQSVGAYPLDVAEIQPDFLVSVGYKWLLGPYGLAYLYVAERWHGRGEPIEESWLHRAGSDNFAGLVDYTDAYRPGAERFGQGASAQFYLVRMALAAVAQIERWTPAAIHERLAAWTDELCARECARARVPRAGAANRAYGRAEIEAATTAKPCDRSRTEAYLCEHPRCVHQSRTALALRHRRAQPPCLGPQGSRAMTELPSGNLAAAGGPLRNSPECDADLQ